MTRNGDRDGVLLRALTEIRDLRGKLGTLEAAAREPIAVIGMACRLPGGVIDPEGLWQFLRRGGDGIGDVPADRGMGTGWRGGFLGDIDRFDAPLFGISPREAAMLDPQQRLFLEVAWEALERAGQSSERLEGSRTGVFLGVTSYDYCQRMMQEVAGDDLEAHCLTSNASTFAAGRLSYLLGLTGPSLSIDTACSSSLVATHLACQSLRSGDSTMAIAAGVNVLLSPEWFSVLSRASMLSPDGYCHTFDRGANGYVRGEGCVALVLKRLSDAVRDRDPIHALLRGSCVNQDGRSSGLTVPNPAAQRAVITGALQAAGVEPARVSYVEAHGTGTPLGDPIEVRALAAVMRPDDGGGAPLAIGSIKANLGHLEPAAGLAGLLKVIVSMQHGELPPQVRLESLNPEIDTGGGRLVIHGAPTAWPGDQPRIAGVSSFGASGTNAHVIVEQAAAVAIPPPAPAIAGLAILSARSRGALVELAARHRDHLRAHPPLALSDVCLTLAAGRTRFAHRLAVAASSTDELAGALDRFAGGEESEDAPSGRAEIGRQPRVAFLFTGQGSQYAGMGRELHATEPVFRQVIDQAEAVLEPVIGCRLTSLLFEGGPGRGAIDETRFTQPALVALEVALARLWQSWGVWPEAVLGHSVGEYAAMVVAGALDLDDALRLVARRGAVMQELRVPGLMAAVFAPPDRVTAMLGREREVTLAAINGPDHVVVSGAIDAVEKLLIRLTSEGIRHRCLVTSHAFHSPLMEPALDAIEEAAASVRFRAPEVPLVSNLTGQPVDAASLGARYLRDHARQPVQFEASARWLLEQGLDAFVEIGPAPTLVGMIKRMTGADGEGRRFLPSLRPKRGDRATILTSLGSLFVAGADVDGEALSAGCEARRIPLATYPFERKPHWYTASAVRPAGQRGASPTRDAEAAPVRSLLGRRIESPLPALQFLASFDPAVHPCLGECVVAGARVVNVGVYVEAALEACALLGLGQPDGVIRDLGIRAPMLLAAEERRAAHVVLSPAGDGGFGFAVYSGSGEPAAGESGPGWVLHAEGAIGRTSAAAPAAIDLAEVRARCTASRSGFEFYEGLWRRQLFLGPSAQWIEQVWSGPREALARMRSARGDEASGYRLHPGLLDACCQLFFAAMPGALEPTAIYMIAAVEELRLVGLPAGAESFCRASLREGGSLERGFVGDVELVDTDGRLIARVGAVTLRRATPELLHAASRAPAPRAVDRAAAPVAAPASGGRRELEEELAHLAPADRVAGAEKVVLAAVAAVLRCPADDLDRRESLSSMGLDSLLALELKEAITRRAGTALPLASFLDGTIHRLAGELVEQLVGASAAAVAPAPAPAGPEADAAVAAPEAAIAAPKAAVAAPTAAPADPSFPLTELQQAYLIGRGPGFELGGVSTQFLLEVDVVGLDLPRLQSSLDSLIARHDMLRAVVTPDGTQRVLASAPPYVIRTEDLRGRGPRETEERLRRTHDELADQVIPADRCPMFDIRASLLDGSATRLHLAFDALVIDAWSTSLLLQELGEVYRHGPGRLTPVGLGFREYVQRVNDPSRDGDRARARAYWEARLTSLPSAPDLPLRVQPSSIGRPRFAHLSFTLESSRWERLKGWARELGLTPSALLCAAYAEVLAGWSRSPRFSLNLLFFNRRPVHPDVARVLGNFSATTLLEVDVDHTADIAARARRLSQQLWRDLDHADFSGVQVLRELNRRRAEPSRAAMPVVFASTIGFGSRDQDQALGLAQHLIGLGESGREVHTSIRTPQVWLDHQLIEQGGQLVANWDFVEELFPPGLIGDMFAAYQGLVERLADDRSAWTELDRALVPAAQLEQRARDNAATGSVPRGLLHEPFEVAAARQPDRPAVIAPDRTLSYRELDRRANAIAHWLRGRGATSTDLVAVMLDKGWAQIAAVLGVLKAGAAYVPIDPQLPRERRRVLLDQIDTRWVITQAGVDVEPSPGATLDVLCADADQLDGVDRPPPRAAGESDLAYVIFTSGSTGTPKGVMIEHRAALNTVLDINRRFAVTADDRTLALSSLSFDLSVYDVFGVLAAGGAIVLPRADRLREPQHWLDLVREHRVTLWNSVPALLEMLVEHVAGRDEALPGLRLVMLSGDWISLQLPDRVRALRPEAQVYSLGGATEASIWSIVFPVHEVDPLWPSIPYGRALTNQQMHVLDEAMRPCPVWKPGRIFIGGVGLARGYLGDDARTAASFMRHPVTGDRLYNTGDLGRYLPSGDIELLGREDLQVKVQGFRIELGEIEAALTQHPGVRAAVVSATGEKLARKRLVAHLVLDPTAPPSVEAVREWLRERLPAYAVPHGFAVLEALPLSGNGKIDRSALRFDEQGARAAAPRAPASETERVVAGFFAELLERSEVGCGTSFFELGGNSLLAVKLVGRVRARFGRELPISALFEHQTVERLAALLDARPTAPERRPLVALQPKGARAPLFWIHPVGGNVGCYVPLARELGPSFPQYGVQAVDPAEAEPSIADMARTYVGAIREVQAHGPYRLLGWSMGGVIAYEMAQQLHAAGERVSCLGFIDVGQEPLPRGRARRPGDDELLSWFERDLLALLGAPPQTDAPRAGGIEGVHQRLVAAGSLPADLDLADVRGWFDTFGRNMRALVAYRAARYPGPIWVARGTAGASRAVADAWVRRAGSGEVIDLAGDHYTLMQSEAGALAGAIRRALRESEGKPGARPSTSSGAKTNPVTIQEGEGGR